MRVLLITQGVSRLVKPLLASKHKVVGVIESMPRYFDPNKRRDFFDVSRNIFSLLKGKDLNLKKICKERSIPYNFLCKEREQLIERWVSDLQPDLIVVFSMSQLLKESLISIPEYGTINLHPSFLPEYRGPNPDFWQYYNLEDNPGVTVHYVDKGEDTGDIIFQQRVHIPLGTKSPERLDKLVTETGVPLMIKAIDRIEDGTAPRLKQPHDSPTPRARNIAKDEHSKVIDWTNWPIERIWNVLRGTEQWLRAIEQPKGVLRGQHWEVGKFVKKRNNNRPGSIVKFEGKNAVSVTDGFILLSIKFSIKKFFIALMK